MKRLLSIFMIINVLLALSCSCTDESGKEILADSEMELNVEGMVCAVGCAKYIEKEVSNLTGVTRCSVDFEKGKAQIAFASEEIEEEGIVNTINSLNDGQFKVSVIDILTRKVEKSGGKREGSKTENADPEVSFYFPELITYFMHRLIR